MGYLSVCVCVWYCRVPACVVPVWYCRVTVVPEWYCRVPACYLYGTVGYLCVICMVL